MEIEQRISIRGRRAKRVLIEGFEVGSTPGGYVWMNFRYVRQDSQHSGGRIVSLLKSVPADEVVVL
jgi:hypothetical protein